MFEINSDVRARLDRGGMSWCMIGGSALAVHGYARFTVDVDILTMDDCVLNAQFWDIQNPPEIRKGDWDDPLRGVVRFHSEPGLDLIIGAGHAMRFAVNTAEMHALLGWRVATPLGMVLLKLEAGADGSKRYHWACRHTSPIGFNRVVTRTSTAFATS